MKKILAFVLAAVMLFSISGLSVWAADSGDFGNGLHWAFDESNGILTITGTGAMPNYDASTANNRPWSSLKVQKVIIENGVTSIGDEAFYDCSDLTSITIPDGVTSIGVAAFYGCSDLTSITIPDGVTSIGNGAFHGCSGLSSVTIPNSVTSIENGTFQDSGLTEIKIPASVTSIGDGAFYNCANLTSMTFEMIDTPSFGNTLVLYSCNNLKTVFIPVGADKEKWREALTDAGLTDFEIKYISNPDPTPQPKPTPASTATPNTIEKMEQNEKPDPADRKAMEAYDFWMKVKTGIKTAKEGKTLRFNVPKEIDNMPASVMETLRLCDKEITLVLKWNGRTITIPAEEAVKKPVNKVFWTVKQLTERYA